MCHLLSHFLKQKRENTSNFLSPLVLPLSFLESPPSSHGTMDEEREGERERGLNDLTGLTQHLLEQKGSFGFFVPREDDVTRKEKEMDSS